MARSRTISRRSAIRSRALIANALIASAVLALAGCSTQSGGQDNDWGQVIDMVGGQFDRHTDIALKQAASVPYATLGVRVGDGPQMMIVLAADETGDKLWTSKARLAITTRNGRVLRTAGLLRNVDAVSFPGGDPVLAAAVGAAPIETTRFVDFWDLNRFSVPLHCVAVSRGADPVTILGKSIATIRVEESCESSAMNWTFTDSFWVGTSGMVWKSIQHTHPDFDPLELEVFRPPAQP